MSEVDWGMELRPERLTDAVDELDNTQVYLPIEITNNCPQKFVDRVVGIVEGLPWQARTMLAVGGHKIVLGEDLPSTMRRCCSDQELIEQGADPMSLSSGYFWVSGKKSSPALAQTIFIAQKRKNDEGKIITPNVAWHARLVVSALALGCLNEMSDGTIDRELMRAQFLDMADIIIDPEKSKITFSDDLEGYITKNKVTDISIFRQLLREVLVRMWGLEGRDHAIPIDRLFPRFVVLANAILKKEWDLKTASYNTHMGWAAGVRGEASRIPAVTRVRRLEA